MSAPAVFKRARRASLTGRPPTVPPISSSDESEWSAEDAPSLPPSLITATHSEDPVDPLRRMNTVLEFAGAGALCIGSALVVSLAAALLILLGRKPAKDDPPPHPKLLRSAALASLFLAVLQCIAGIILYVLLERQDSFVDFCMQNLPTMTAEDCVARWDRNWVIVLAVSLVLIFHVALGFPVYRYTRGSEYGKQFDDRGSLLELGPSTGSTRHRRRRSSLSLFDSDSDSSLERHMLEEVKRRGSARSLGSRRGLAGGGRRERRRASAQDDSATEGDSSAESRVEADRRSRRRRSRSRQKL